MKYKYKFTNTGIALGLAAIRALNWLLAKFRRGVWHMMALTQWLDLQRKEMRRTHDLVREVSIRIEQNRIDIKALKEARDERHQS